MNCFVKYAKTFKLKKEKRKTKKRPILLLLSINLLITP